MKRTIQQQQTIDAPLGNILVSAAAGSGKTSVMTERIVTRITMGELDIRDVLVMTFTDAAAKNMRDKIEKQLRTASVKQEFLQKQLAYLGQSSISTIHAFCLDVIRNFYYEAADPSGKLLLEPGFRIEEQGEAKILLERALDDLFETYYARCDRMPDASSTQNFLFLVDAYGSSKDDSPVRSLILSFYHFLRSMPDYEEWIERQKALIESTIRDFDHSLCFKALYKGLLLRAERAGEGMAELEEFLSAQPCLYRNDKSNMTKNKDTLDALQGFCRFIRDAVAMVKNPDVTWDGLYSFFQNRPSIPNLKHHPAETDEKSKWIDLFMQYFAEFLYYTTGEFGTPRYESQFLFEKCFLFNKSKEEIVRELAAMKPAVECFFGILTDLDQEYSKAKREANMIDFDDFEHLALKILKVPAVKQYYQLRFKEIYIDEYQDTSSIQEAILEAVSTGNCFMVGDVKQSIYKFRHARPRIFMGKYDTFRHSCEDGNAESGIVFELNKNFRSVAGILHAVNDVFWQIMSKAAGEIDYNESQSLVPGREDVPMTQMSGSEGAEAQKTSAPVEVLLVDLSKGDGQETEEPEEAKENPDAAVDGENPEEGDDSEKTGSRLKEPEEPPLSREEATKYQKEAFAVAVRIKEFLDGKTEASEGEEKEASEGEKDSVKTKPGEIAVLARTRSICGVFADTLKLFGLPVEQEQTETFLDRYELKVIEALLIILDNPMQDIPLASVMRAPLFENGFDEAELLRIRTEYKDRDYFYECCESYAAKGTDIALREKLRSFYQGLSRLRNRLVCQSVSELIETIYTETDFLATAARMPDGLQRVSSLQDFQDWARGYDQSRQSGLYSFVRYMEAVHEKSPGQSPFGIEQSQSDSIKVMTMHKSKGLEYKVVFLVGNNRKMTPRDTRDSILVSEEFGIGFHYVDVKQQYRCPTPLILAMRESMRNAELAEEMRLFYVGMTRAKDRLFITGTCSVEDHTNDKGLAVPIGKARKYPSGSPLPPHVALSAKNTLEWVMLSIARNPSIDFGPLGIASFKEETSQGASHCSQSWSLNVTGYQYVQKKVQEILENQSVPANPKMAPDEPDGSGTYCKEQDQNSPAGLSDEKVEALYRARFLAEYPYENATQSPLKISVSEIKRREQSRIQDEPSAPFPNQSALFPVSSLPAAPLLPASPYPVTPLSPSLTPFRSVNTVMKELSRTTATVLEKSDIGIAVHSFLRYMDLRLLMENPTKKIILEHMDQMLEADMIQKLEYDYLTTYADAFEAYLHSNLAERIYLAGKQTPPALFREIPFTIKLDCKALFGEQGFESKDCTFGQGMIDCWFVEKGEAVLVDYKTDKIEGTEEQVRQVLEERYRTQLSIYAQAITKTTRLHVKESIVWLVNTKKQFIMRINEEGRGMTPREKFN